MNTIAQRKMEVFETGQTFREKVFTTDWSLPEPARAEVIPFVRANNRRERLFAVEWASAEPMLGRTLPKAVTGMGLVHSETDYYCEWA